MAALGLVSGVISAVVGVDRYLPWLEAPVWAVFFLNGSEVPIGFLFGAAVALSLWLWTGKTSALMALPVTTMYAWSAATKVAMLVSQNVGDPLHMIAASLAAGAVGAGITHLGCAIPAPELLQPRRIALTCAVGALAGLLFYAGYMQLLFAIWQPAVACAIGLGLKGERVRT